MYVAGCWNSEILMSPFSFLFRKPSLERILMRKGGQVLFVIIEMNCAIWLMLNV